MTIVGYILTGLLVLLFSAPGLFEGLSEAREYDLTEERHEETTKIYLAILIFIVAAWPLWLAIKAMTRRD